MRISLLRQREPFGEILEQTLARYLQWETDSEHSVQWGDGKQSRVGQSGTTFLANEYLNIIFHPSLPQAAFDPIRREFSRSLVAWRRPIQRAYVECATRSPFSHWTSHARLTIRPESPELSRQLIVPGNQKLRILDHAASVCTSVLKVGFRDDAMRAEVDARQIAKKLDILVPETLEVDIENGILREAYVSATPLNRIADATTASKSLKDAVGYISKLTVATKRTESLSTYLDGLANEINNRLNPYDTKNQNSVKRTKQVVRLLLNQASETAKQQPSDATDPTIPLAMAHGDFQPANIMVNAAGTWLIDWENFRERQSGYDWLVNETRTRREPNIAETLVAFIDNEKLKAPDWAELALNSREQRLFHVSIFLLEELATKLNEVAHPAIPELAGDYLRLLNEIETWLDRTDK